MEKYKILLSVLPEFLQAPVTAMLLITMGYFLSKVVAGFVDKFAKSFARFSFWTSWSAFIVFAYIQIPLIAKSIAGLTEPNIIMAVLMSGLILSQIGPKLKLQVEMKVLPGHKFIHHILMIAIIIVASLCLFEPTTLAKKAGAVSAVAIMAILPAKTFSEVFRPLDNEHISNAVFYLVYAAVLVPVIFYLT